MSDEFEKELKFIRKNAFGVHNHPLKRIAVDEDICKRLAERFDCETGGECSEVRFVQQVLLEIYNDIEVEKAEKRLNDLKNTSY